MKQEKNTYKITIYDKEYNMTEDDLKDAEVKMNNEFAKAWKQLDSQKDQELQDFIDNSENIQSEIDFESFSTDKLKKIIKRYGKKERIIINKILALRANEEAK